jgi:lysophospholipase L1-like esterase
MRSTHLQRWGAFTAFGASALVAGCGSPESSARPPASSSGAAATPDATRDPGAAVDPSAIDPSASDPSPSGPAPEADSATDTSPITVASGEAVDTDIDLAPDDDAEGASNPGNADEAGEGEGTTPPADPAVDPEPTAAGPITIFLAGDSIVQTYTDTASDRDQAGWGQMLGENFDDRVTVENRAIGGRTARRFIDEGRLDTLVDELEPGNFLLVQFGTNDGNRTATYTIGDQVIPYFLDPATDFKTYLQRYVDAAESRGASAVFVTPTPRNSAYCTGGNGTGAHAAAMKELGQASGVRVVDLNASAVEYLRQICPAPTPEDFFLLRADGTVDGTHFQERGARILAGFVADGLRALGLPFAAYRLDAP